MPQRTYSEKEVAQIIKRAAEMESDQSGEKQFQGDQPGLSLDELSAIAVEAGLDPQNVREAALELESPPKKSSTKSHKEEIYSERWVKGELTEDLSDLVIADLNHRYNASNERKSWIEDILEDDSQEWVGKSKVQRTGKSLEWKHLNEYGTVEVRVLIQPRKDQIRIRVSKKNVWGTGISEMDGDLIEYLGYMPYLAAFVVLLSLPYSFLFNTIIAILAFAGLQFMFIPIAKKLADKWTDWMERSGSKKKEKKSEQYRQEVESVADELAQLLGESREKAQSSGRIEINSDSSSAKHQESEGTGKKRSREEAIQGRSDPGKSEVRTSPLK